MNGYKNKCLSKHFIHDWALESSLPKTVVMADRQYQYNTEILTLNSHTDKDYQVDNNIHI